MIDKFKNTLDKWNSIQTIDELDERFVNCKKWIFVNGSNLDEIKEMTYLCNDAYWSNVSRIDTTK